MATSPALSEARRKAVLNSWAKTGDDPAARKARTAPAAAARGRVAEVVAEVAGLKAVISDLEQRLADLEAARN